MKILLVEDSPDSQRLITTQLESLGHTVTLKADGETAFEAALKDEYDVVLMDLELPRKSGLQAAIELRDEHYDKPIIAISAFGKFNPQHCLDAGCDDYLEKPVNKTSLADAIDRWVTKYTSS